MTDWNQGMNAVMGNPMFHMGLGLLGSGGNARGALLGLNSYQQMQQAQLMNQYRQAQMAQMAAQQAAAKREQEEKAKRLAAQQALFQGHPQISQIAAANPQLAWKMYQNKVMPPQADPFTLAPGTIRYDAQGNIIAQAPHKPAEPKAPPQRRIVEDAAGFKRFADTGERVFPNVQVAPKTEKVKAPTEGQLASGGYADRMISAEDIMGKVVESGYKPASIWEHTKAVSNYTASPEYQQYRQAQENWVRAKLRKESGAVIGEEEMESEIKVYFPQPGDSAAVIKQKANARKVAVSAMIRMAGPAYQKPEQSGWSIKEK